MCFHDPNDIVTLGGISLIVVGGVVLERGVMTDPNGTQVFISYARDDRSRVRPMLRSWKLQA
jgi:hypothetical protein